MWPCQRQKENEGEVKVKITKENNKTDGRKSGIKVKWATNGHKYSDKRLHRALNMLNLIMKTTWASTPLARSVAWVGSCSYHDSKNHDHPPRVRLTRTHSLQSAKLCASLASRGFAWAGDDTPPMSSVAHWPVVAPGPFEQRAVPRRARDLNCPSSPAVASASPWASNSDLKQEDGVARRSIGET